MDNATGWAGTLPAERGQDAPATRSQGQDAPATRSQGQDAPATRSCWTQKDLQVLIEHYPSGGAMACLEHLPGRTLASVQARAHKLGLRIAGRKIGLPMASSDWIDVAIRRYYRSAPKRGALADLCRRIGRTRQWVLMRAVVLGVAPVRDNGGIWSEEEDALLDRFASLHPEVISKRLRAHGFRRSPAAIVQRISRSGIDRSDPDAWTARDLALGMGVNEKTALRWIAHHGLRAIRNPHGSGDPNERPWRIERADLRAWLIGSAAWDHRRCTREWLVEALTAKGSVKPASSRLEAGSTGGAGA